MEGVYGLRFFVFLLVAAAGLLHAAPSFCGDTPSRNVLLAQNTESPADTAAVPDLSGVPPTGTPTVRPPSAVPPKTALYHSMALPGWGQLDNGKKLKAAVLIAAELFFVGGALYEQYLLGGDDLTRFERDQIRTNRNSFIIYWLGARVYGMVDAYVDAQLRGFNVRDIAPPGLKRIEFPEKEPETAPPDTASPAGESPPEETPEEEKK